MKKAVCFFAVLLLLGAEVYACPDIHYPCRTCEQHFFDIYEEGYQATIDCFDQCEYTPYDGCPSPLTDDWGNTYWEVSGQSGCFCVDYSDYCYEGDQKVYGVLHCFYSLGKPPEEECFKENERYGVTECSPGQTCTYQTVGNSIGVLSRKVEDVETDIQFNSPFSIGFSLYRTYNSQLHRDSPIGFGWTNNFNVILAPMGLEGSIAYIIQDESNRLHYFKYNDYDGYFVGIMSTKGYLTTETDGTWIWHRGNGTTYTFDQQLRFIAKQDGNGNVQTLTHDANDRLETVTDGATGRSIGFVYTPEGRIDHITGPVTDAVPDGIWVSYQYDTEGNLTLIEYADDNNGSASAGFEYKYEDSNDVHNLTEKRNLAGEFLSSWEYDSLDRAWKTTTRDGEGVELSFATGQVVVTDAQGAQKNYLYENVNNFRRITEIIGGSCAGCGADTVRFIYDDQRRVVEKEYASGRIDGYADFDDNDRYQTKIQAANTPQGRAFNYTYHPETGDKLSIIEASILGSGDKETVFDYDNDGDDIPNENPTLLMYRRIERGFTYDAAGTVLPYEHVTRYTYTAKGQVLTVDGPLPGDQDKITCTYDPITGDMLSETQPLVGTTSYTYDGAGNVTTITDVNGVVTTMTYDGRNRPLSSTRNSVTTTRTYTAAGELDTTTDVLNRTTDYIYNTAGFVEKITDPSGNFVYYGYNGLGQRIEESIYASDSTRTQYSGTDWGDPAGNPDLVSGKPWKSIRRNHDDTADLETVYAYDIQGNLAGVTDAENQVTTYTYDDLGRLVETSSPDTGITSYSYDEAGNLRYKVQNGNTVEYQYDALGRLTYIQYSDPAQNVTLSYDSGAGSNLIGRLASVTDPSGTTQYSYDAEGRLTTETRTINSIPYVTGYGYDDAGNLRTLTYPTGQTVTYVPDAADPEQIASVVLNTTQTLASGITYKPFGPVSALSLGNSVTLSKTYDLNYQLGGLTYAGVLERTYSPDNEGNITAITDTLDPTRSQSFAYDDLYRLTSASGIYGAITYTYDKVGNRLSRTQNSEEDTYLYYPGTNRLNIVAGKHPEQILYDSDGNTTQRIPGATNPAPGVTDPADYFYNSGGQRVKKDNSVDKVFHYDLTGRLIAETDATGVLIKAYVRLQGEPLAQIAADGAVSYYHNDHLGTPQKMTDASGAAVWAADYLPFGRADVTIGTVENHLRFAGQYFDQETGFHYNFHRYYDPRTGRYLTPDPIGLKGGINLFVYVENNPIMNTDPLGLWTYDAYCRYISGGAHIGGGVLKCQVKGPCINNKRTVWMTETTVVGFTEGSPGGWTYFSMTLDDRDWSSDYPDGSKLLGASHIYSAGGALPGFGGSYADIKMGSAYYSGVGKQTGIFDASIDVGWGLTTWNKDVPHYTWQENCCNE